MSDIYSQGRVCGCGKRLTNNSKTGKCRTCFVAFLNSDPANRQKISDGVRRFARENPLVAKRNAIKAAASRVKSPEQLERLREQMRRIQPLSYTPEAMARRDMVARGAKVREFRLSWCPPEYRDEYTALREQKGMRAPEARRMILEQVARDEAKLSPFERQELALKRGAKLVANDTAPSLHNPANYGEERWTYGR